MQNTPSLRISWQLLSFMCTAVSALVVSEAPDQRYPVTRVVNLLKDMKAQLESEKDKDEGVYEKFAAWCETNDMSKTKAIVAAEEKLVRLQAAIENTIAKSEILKVGITAEAQELTENQRSLAAASSLREKQSSEFTQEEKEMMESIQALDAAILVLSKHHSGAGAALIDESRRADSATSSASATNVAGATAKLVLQAAVTATRLFEQNEKLLRTTMTHQQDRILRALVEQPGAIWKQAYTPQSGEVFGILKQIKETFESNLAEGQKQELAEQESFKLLKAAKDEEIRVGQVTVDDKRQQLAAAEEEVVQAKNEREDTQSILSADKAYLLDLKSRCTLTDQEWEERQRSRQEEISAVDEAISLLTTDDARILFSKAFNNVSAFVQTHRWSSNWRRDHAAAVLEQVAKKSVNPKLSALAMSVHIDAFVRVKRAIDDMVSELLKEAADELQHQKYCVDELASNERSTAEMMHTEVKVQSRVDMLEVKVDSLKTTIETVQANIADAKKQREQARIDRQIEHSVFEAAVADQRQTQVLLMKALDALRAVYAKATPTGAVLAERKARYGPPSPEGFDVYEKQRRSSPILALLDHILEDVKAMEAEYVREEDKALIAYQDFVQQTVRVVEANQKSLIDRQAEKAQADKDVAEAHTELGQARSDLEDLSRTLSELKSGCNYFLANFDVRTRARGEEISALREAKTYLSGMQPHGTASAYIEGAGSV